MNDLQRVPSAKSIGGSRRRRWEVKSKESFETSLAIEIESPEKKTYRNKKGLKTEPSAESLKEKNSFNSSYRDNTKASFPKAPPQKINEEKDSNDTDLLSSRISALLDEASVTVKDTKRRSAKQKDKQQKSEPDLDTDKNRENSFQYKEEKRPARDNVSEDYIIDNLKIKPLKGNDKAQILNDKFETKSLKVADIPLMKTEYEESDHVASAPPLPSDEEETPKNKKHKKKRDSTLLLVTNANEESYITLQLKEMDDDIINVTKEDKDCPLSVPKLIFAASTSHPLNNISTIYHEKLGGFVVARNEFNGVRRKNEDLHDLSQVPTRSSHAVFLQGGFRTFSVLSQGLLAGITLAHCLLIFLLDRDPMKVPGLLYPSSLAHAFFALIIFLTTICLVAACDRSDLIGTGVLSGHGIKVPWTTAFYISSLVLSLVAIRTENVLINFQVYQSSGFSEKEVTELVNWWRWVCVARSSLAVLAWLAVVPDPHTDALLDFIQEFNRS